MDVDEGIRCLLFGKPNQIPADKLKFYLAYAKQYEEKDDDQQEVVDGKPVEKDTEVADDDFNIERIVSEYQTIKTVLINNSFPVDIAVLQSGAQYNVGA